MDPWCVVQWSADSRDGALQSLLSLSFVRESRTDKQVPLERSAALADRVTAAQARPVERIRAAGFLLASVDQGMPATTCKMAHCFSHVQLNQADLFVLLLRIISLRHRSSRSGQAAIIGPAGPKCLYRARPCCIHNQSIISQQ